MSVTFFQGAKFYISYKKVVKVSFEILFHFRQLHCIPWKWWKIYNHAFVVTMTLANFWKLAIESCDSFILILILFMLSLCCGIHENCGKREEEGGGGGGRFKKYEFCKKNNYCKGCKKQRIFRFMLSFIMSSWDLLFSRITSSHVSLKNRGARCTRGLGWYRE